MNMKAPAPPPPGSIQNGVTYEIDCNDQKTLSTYNAIVYNMDNTKKWQPVLNNYVTIFVIDHYGEELKDRYSVDIVGQRKKIMEYKMSSSTKIKCKDSFVRLHNEFATIGAKFTNQEMASKFNQQMLNLVTELAPYAKVNKEKMTELDSQGREKQGLAVDAVSLPAAEKDVSVINIQISPTDTTQFKATTDMSLKEVLQTVCKIHALEINSGIFQYTDIKDSSVTLSTTVGELKSRNLKLVVIQDRKKSVESSSKPDRAEKKGRFSSLFSKSKSDVKPVDNFKDNGDLRLHVDDPVWRAFLDLANLHVSELANPHVCSVIESFVYERGGYSYLRQVNDQKMSPQLADDLNVLAGQVHMISPSPEAPPVASFEMTRSTSLENLIGSPSSSDTSTLERKKNKRRAPPPPSSSKPNISEADDSGPAYADIKEIQNAVTASPNGKRRAPTAPRLVPNLADNIKSSPVGKRKEDKPPPIFVPPPPPDDPPPEDASSPVGPLSPEPAYASVNKTKIDQLSKEIEKNEEKLALDDLDRMLSMEDKDDEEVDNDDSKRDDAPDDKKPSASAVVTKSADKVVKMESKESSPIPQKTERVKKQKKKLDLTDDSKKEITETKAKTVEIKSAPQVIDAPQVVNAPAEQLVDIQKRLEVAESLQNSQQQQLIQQQLLQLQMQVLQQQQMLFAAGLPVPGTNINPLQSSNTSTQLINPTFIPPHPMVQPTPPPMQPQASANLLPAHTNASASPAVTTAATPVVHSVPLLDVIPPRPDYSPPSVPKTTLTKVSSELPSKEDSISANKPTESPTKPKPAVAKDPTPQKKPPSGLYAKLKAKTASNSSISTSQNAATAKASELPLKKQSVQSPLSDHMDGDKKPDNEISAVVDRVNVTPTVHDITPSTGGVATPRLATTSPEVKRLEPKSEPKVEILTTELLEETSCKNNVEATLPAISVIPKTSKQQPSPAIAVVLSKPAQDISKPDPATVSSKQTEGILMSKPVTASPKPTGEILISEPVVVSSKPTGNILKSNSVTASPKPTADILITDQVVVLSKPTEDLSKSSSVTASTKPTEDVLISEPVVVSSKPTGDRSTSKQVVAPSKLIVDMSNTKSVDVPSKAVENKSKLEPVLVSSKPPKDIVPSQPFRKDSIESAVAPIKSSKNNFGGVSRTNDAVLPSVPISDSVINSRTKQISSRASASSVIASSRSPTIEPSIEPVVVPKKLKDHPDTLVDNSHKVKYVTVQKEITSKKQIKPESDKKKDQRKFEPDGLVVLPDNLKTTEKNSKNTVNRSESHSNDVFKVEQPKKQKQELSMNAKVVKKPPLEQTMHLEAKKPTKEQQIVNKNSQNKPVKEEPPKNHSNVINWQPPPKTNTVVKQTTTTEKTENSTKHNILMESPRDRLIRNINENGTPVITNEAAIQSHKPYENGTRKTQTLPSPRKSIPIQKDVYDASALRKSQSVDERDKAPGVKPKPQRQSFREESLSLGKSKPFSANNSAYTRSVSEEAGTRETTTMKTVAGLKLGFVRESQPEIRSQETHFVKKLVENKNMTSTVDNEISTAHAPEQRDVQSLPNDYSIKPSEIVRAKNHKHVQPEKQTELNNNVIIPPRDYNISEDEVTIRPSEIIRARTRTQGFKEPPQTKPKTKVIRTQSSEEQERNVKPSELFGLSKTLPKQSKTHSNVSSRSNIDLRTTRQ